MNPMPAEPTLSAVVVTHRGGELLGTCLDALVPQLDGSDEVLVVVSARPGRADLTRVLGRASLVELGANQGYARAANAGLTRAGGELLLVLNDDTRALPGFVQALKRAAHRPGLYQPRILLDDGSGRLDNTGHGLFPDGFNWAIGREDSDGPPYDQARDVGACSGAAIGIHRRVYETVGAFDEDLESYGEDVDLSLRARRRGFPLRYVPDARIAHVLGATYGRYGARKCFLIERNRVRVAVRSLPWTALITMPAWTGLRVAGLGAAALCGRGWGARLDRSAGTAALAGMLSGLAHIPDALAKRSADARSWSIDEREMWRHLVQNRVRMRDLLRP
jgi:GT2 family glycosyltransferase